MLAKARCFIGLHPLKRTGGSANLSGGTMKKQVVIEVDKPFTQELFMDLLVQAIKICIETDSVEREVDDDLC